MDVVESSLMACDTRVDELDRLSERGLEVYLAGRGTLAVSLFSRAENLATQLHSDDTCLVPAWLRLKRAASLVRQGILAREAAKGTPREDAGKEESAGLRVQAWELLQDVITLVQRRTAVGTTVRKRVVPA